MDEFLGAMTQGGPQQQPMMQQYTHPSMFNKLSPTPATSMVQSSRITGDINSAVYYHSGQGSQLVEHSVRQMVTADGTVFVEHIPGFSLVYVPNNWPAEQVLGMNANTRLVKGNSAAARASRNHKPKIKNAFILYRSSKCKELREKHPEMNQIEISRLAGKLWSEELEEVKSAFYEKYRKQKVERDNCDSASCFAKRSRRGSSSSRDLPSAVLDANQRHKRSASSLELYEANFEQPRPQTLPPQVHKSSTPYIDSTTDSHQKFDLHDDASLLATSLFEPNVLQPVPVKQHAPYFSQQAVFTESVSSALSANDTNGLANALNSSTAVVTSSIADTSGIPASAEISQVSAASAVPASSMLSNTFYDNLMDMPLSELQTNVQ
ncbi:hypothetical protein EV183_005443 [Coemansia sp. RSA 2336]|nr:hypothetical protein EV183_005443 [Coemansia sp. RSA 2336]